MKIKTKKQLNLPQLIEWGWNNPSLSRNKRFFSKDEKLGITKHCVHFNDFGYPEVDNRYCLEPADTFTVEVEEKLTESTVIPKLVTRNTSGGYNEWGNDCVNSFNLEYIKAIYILNDDLSLTLIWTHEKGLVN